MRVGRTAKLLHVYPRKAISYIHHQEKSIKAEETVVTTVPQPSGSTQNPCLTVNAGAVIQGALSHAQAASEGLGGW